MHHPGNGEPSIPGDVSQSRWWTALSRLWNNRGMEHEHIAPDLRPLAKPIGWFKLDPHNARRHPVRNLKIIRESLKEYGQQKLVVALDDGTLVAGNGTYLMAQRLGWQSLAVSVFADSAKAQQFALVDNRSAELAEWDDREVAAQLKELPADIRERIGWNDKEMQVHVARSNAGAGAAFLDDLRGGDGEDKGPTKDAGTRAEYVDLVLSMTVEERATVYEKLRDVKRNHNLKTTTEAFLYVVRSAS